MLETKKLDWPIGSIPGITIEDQTKLANCGIFTTSQLLDRGCNSQQQLTLSTEVQLPIRHIQKWVVLADLAGIPGIGCQYCGLLLHAGILSSEQLAQTSTQKLHQHLLRLQVITLQRRDLCPTTSQVAQWIQAAIWLQKRS